MNNRHVLFALHHMAGIGWHSIYRLVQSFPELAELCAASAADWATAGFPDGRGEALRKGLQDLRDGALPKLLLTYESRGIGWVTVWDDAYPTLLKQIAQPPWLLYYRGDPELLARPCFAVVGTRRPTAYGVQAAGQLAQELAAAGLCIVSGLARGIDSAAHRGGLSAAGGTMAVLGCAIDQIYPPDNTPLYNSIAEKGLIVSEYPIGTKGHPGLFPQRNRIIAGLSLGVLVVEAALRSGSLITADQALEESRDVFAVPGPIGAVKSQGTLALLKQGAKLVTSAQDVIEEYPHRISQAPSAYINDTKGEQPELGRDEARVVELLAFRDMTVDELLTQTQFSFGHLHSVLINLLLTRRVVELPGSVYSLP